MSNMIIREQSDPRRCEICHQTDCFDPVINFCSRCADVNNNLPVIAGNKVKNDGNGSNSFFLRLTTTSGDGQIYRLVCAFLSFIIGLLLYVNLFSEYGIWPDKYGLFSLSYFLIMIGTLMAMMSSIVPLKVIKAILILIVSLLFVFLLFF